MPHKITDEEKSLLTEEELAGLEDDTLVDEGQDIEDDAAGEEAGAAAAAEEAKAAEASAEAAAGKGEQAGIGDDPKKPVDEAKTQQPADVQEQMPAGDAPADKPMPAATKPAGPLPNWKAPEDASDRLKDIDAQIDTLASKFDDGELTAVEYRQQTRDLENQRRQLDREILKEQLSKESAADLLERQKSEWFDGTVPKFLEAYPEYRDKPLLLGALNSAVLEIQTAQLDNQFDPDVLVRADAKVREQLGLAPRNTAAKVVVPPRDIPPSLAHVPAAEPEDVEGNSEFAALDRLEGVAYEAALARMPDDVRERYLAR